MYAEAARRVRPQRQTTIRYKTAQTREERQDAFALVYDRYFEGGLTPYCPSGLRITRQHLLDSTDIFLATKNEEVVFTISLARGDEESLPMEAVFPDIADDMRQRGLRIAEAFSLAGAAESSTQGLQRWIGLTRALLQVCQRDQIDALVAAMHPRHLEIYGRFVGVRPISDVRCYPGVMNKPAVACLLDLNECRQHPTRRKLYFEDQLDPDDLIHRPIDDDDREYFYSLMAANGGLIHEPCECLAVAG